MTYAGVVRFGVEEAKQLLGNEAKKELLGPGGVPLVLKQKIERFDFLTYKADEALPDDYWPSASSFLAILANKLHYKPKDLTKAVHSCQVDGEKEVRLRLTSSDHKKAVGEHVRQLGVDGYSYRVKEYGAAGGIAQTKTRIPMRLYGAPIYCTEDDISTTLSKFCDLERVKPLEFKEYPGVRNCNWAASITRVHGDTIPKYIKIARKRVKVWFPNYAGLNYGPMYDPYGEARAARFEQRAETHRMIQEQQEALDQEDRNSQLSWDDSPGFLESSYESRYRTIQRKREAEEAEYIGDTAPQHENEIESGSPILIEDEEKMVTQAQAAQPPATPNLDVLSPSILISGVKPLKETRDKTTEMVDDEEVLDTPMVSKIIDDQKRREEYLARLESERIQADLPGTPQIVGDDGEEIQPEPLIPDLITFDTQDSSLDDEVLQAKWDKMLAEAQGRIDEAGDAPSGEADPASQESAPPEDSTPPLTCPLETSPGILSQEELANLQQQQSEPDPLRAPVDTIPETLQAGDAPAGETEVKSPALEAVSKDLEEGELEEVEDETQCPSAPSRDPQIRSQARENFCRAWDVFFPPEERSRSRREPVRRALLNPSMRPRNYPMDRSRGVTPSKRRRPDGDHHPTTQKVRK